MDIGPGNSWNIRTRLAATMPVIRRKLIFSFFILAVHGKGEIFTEVLSHEPNTFLKVDVQWRTSNSTESPPAHFTS
jgi:hypothetical protein